MTKKKSPLEDINGQIMVMSAHRYSLNRQTYVAGSCIDWLKEWWEEFEENTKYVILRDTIFALQDNTAGDPKIDAPHWKNFAQWIYDQYNPIQKQAFIKAIEYRNMPIPINTSQVNIIKDDNSRCMICGGTMSWCESCNCYTSLCCQEYGTCQCS